MTEREIMLAVDPSGRVSEIELTPTISKEDFVTADEEIDQLVARILGEKLDDRVRDYRAALSPKVR